MFCSLLNGGNDDADKFGFFDIALEGQTHSEQQYIHNSELGTFVECWGGHDVGGSLLLMLELGFVSPSNPRFANTVEAIGAKLSHGEHIYRYLSENDFGRPEAAFNICTFWYIDTLASIGKREEVCKLFNNMYDSVQEPCWLIVQGYQPEHG